MKLKPKGDVGERQIVEGEYSLIRQTPRVITNLGLSLEARQVNPVFHIVLETVPLRVRRVRRPIIVVVYESRRELNLAVK